MPLLRSHSLIMILCFFSYQLQAQSSTHINLHEIDTNQYFLPKDTSLVKQLQGQAISLANEEKWEASIPYLEFAEAIIRKTSPKVPAQLAQHYGLNAEILHEWNKFGRAAQYYDRAIMETSNLQIIPSSKRIYWFKQAGNCFFENGDYKIALERYNSGLRENEQSEDYSDSTKVLLLRQSGNTLHALGKDDEALLIYQEALEMALHVFGDKHLITAKVYDYLGTLYEDQGKAVQAMELEQKRLAIMSAHYRPDAVEMADVYEDLGKVYHLQGNFELAISSYKKAQAIMERHTSTRHSLAISLGSLGISYEKNGQLNEAIECYEKQLSIYRTEYSEEKPRFVFSYNNLGVCYDKKGDYRKSIEYFQKALDLGIRTMGSEHPEVAGAYNNLGVANYNSGDIRLGLSYHQKALAIRQKVLVKNHISLGYSNNNVGLGYVELGANDLAITYLLKGLEIKRINLPETHPSIAKTLSTLGEAYTNKGEFVIASPYLDSAYEMRQKVFGVTHIEVFDAELLLSNHYFVKGAYQQASKWAKSAIRTMQKMAEPVQQQLVAAQTILGDIYTKEQKYDLAVNAYEEGLALSKIDNLEQPKTLSDISDIKLLHNYGNLRLSMFHENQEFTNLQQAHQLLQLAMKGVSIHLNRISEQSQLTEAQLIHSIHAAAFEVTHRLYGITKKETYLKELYPLSERSKNNLLYRGMKASNALSFAGLPSELLQKEYDLRTELAYLEKQEGLSLRKGIDLTDSTFLNTQSQLFDLREEYNDLVKSFEQKYPKYFQLKYATEIPSLDELQNNVLGTNQSMIQYVVRDSNIFILLIKKNNFLIKSVDLNYALKEQIERLRHGLYGFHTTSNKTDRLLSTTTQAYTTAASSLYQSLIAPIAKDLTDELIIIPDGVLGYIPFSTLLEEAPSKPHRFHTHKYFGNNHRISYAYSASLYLEMIANKQRHQSLQKYIGFAPFYDLKENDNANKARSITGNELELGQLKFSAEEVKMGKELFGGEVYLGKEATRDVFARKANKAKILHLATHGWADNTNGALSFLAFNAKKDSLDQGFLYVQDLYNIPMQSKLVILSACETGVGELAKGEGIIGLTRAFTYAGVESILTSLWQVDDAKTQELITLFCQHLSSGKSKNEALWLAKKEFREKFQLDAHPYYWAGFILLGDSSPIDLP